MNIRDAQDSWETGRKRWEDFIAGKEMEWNAPAILEQIVIGLAELPPEILAKLPPETARRIKGMLGGTNGTFARQNVLEAQPQRFTPAKQTQSAGDPTQAPTGPGAGGEWPGMGE